MHGAFLFSHRCFFLLPHGRGIPLQGERSVPVRRSPPERIPNHARNSRQVYPPNAPPPQDNCIGLGLVRLLQDAKRFEEARTTLYSLDDGFQCFPLVSDEPRRKPFKGDSSSSASALPRIDTAEILTMTSSIARLVRRRISQRKVPRCSFPPASRRSLPPGSSPESLESVP